MYEYIHISAFSHSSLSCNWNQLIETVTLEFGCTPRHMSKQSLYSLEMFVETRIARPKLTVFIIQTTNAAEWFRRAHVCLNFQLHVWTTELKNYSIEILMLRKDPNLWKTKRERFLVRNVMTDFPTILIDLVQHTYSIRFDTCFDAITSVRAHGKIPSEERKKGRSARR